MRSSVALLIVFVMAGAQARAEPSDYGRIRHRLDGKLISGLSSSDRQLTEDDVVPVAALGLKLTQTIAPRIYARTEVDIASRQVHGGQAPVILREAYLNYGDGPGEIRLGVQIIRWARTDVVNPLDVVTPYRYDWLTFTDAEQRVGALAARYSHRFEGFQLSAVFLPLFRPSTVPLGDTRGLIVRNRHPHEPMGAFGLRAEGTQGALDWGLVALSHRSLRPNLVPYVMERSVSLGLHHPRELVFGADFAYQWRSIIFRGESAYTRTDDCCESLGASFTKRDNLFTVAGLEIVPYSGWRLVAQILQRSAFEQPDGRRILPTLLADMAIANDVLNDEARSSNTGLSVGLYSANVGSRLSVAVDGAWLAETDDFAVRPRITWTLRDNVELRLAADVYRGSTREILGRLERNSLVMIAAVYNFEAVNGE